MITPEQKLEQYPLHESVRGYFGLELFKQMANNPDIFLVVGDLGYKLFDPHRECFPSRCINVGAAEQTMVGVGVGLAMEGAIPFCYSITPFLLFRPAETIRNYINREKIPVKLVGSGFEDDYKHDGFSHYAGDDEDLLGIWRNIVVFHPQTKEQIPSIIEEVVSNQKPSYINLRR